MNRVYDNQVQPFETEHIAAVRQLAAECTLMLKSDGTLPLGKPCAVALYGSGARRTLKGGTGSGDVNVRHFVTVEEGLEKAGFTILTKDWMDSYDQCLADARKHFVEQVRREAAELGINPVLYGMGKAMPEPEYEFPMEADSDLAVYILSRNSGEGSDRSVTPGDIRLSGTEIRDIRKLNERYEKFILVLNTGGLVDLEPVADVKNILLLGQLGTPTGDVLADLLLGKSYPSGKLAMTWAPISEYPSTEGFGDMDDTYYREGIYVGYRYFDSFGKEPTYPFGYGLSYTTFALKTESLTVNGSAVDVSVRVTNTGAYRGKEVVQVYYSAPQGKLDHPYRELAAYVKTGELAPGESELVKLSFDAADMASYDTEAAAYLLGKGDYIVRVGNSSAQTAAAGIVRLPEAVYTRKLKNICPGWGFEDLKPENCTDAGESAELPVVTVAPETLKAETVVYCELPGELPAADGCSWEEVVRGEKTVEDFAAGLDNSQLAYLNIGRFGEGDTASMIGAASQKVAGAAGETTGKLSSLGLPSLVMADGPAGVRVCRKYKMVGETAKGMDDALAGMMEFADPEMLQMMAANMPRPSQEELEAPVCYAYCMAIPIGTCLAQSFNEAVAEACGDIVGDEMERMGINLWLAPAMNIQRSPLCGRDFEYYSEDPVVSGLTAAAVTKGVQKHPGCGTTVKHYTANNQETNRVASNSILSERALREIYLRGFEICLKKSAPAAVMSSYNLINGEHVNNSRDLITHVLRDEWGYQGIVMTDWYGADDMMSRANARPNKHVPGYASGCVHAENDLVMPGIPEEYENILHALEVQDVPYPITRAQLQKSAVRVLETILKMSQEG